MILRMMTTVGREVLQFCEAPMISKALGALISLSLEVFSKEFEHLVSRIKGIILPEWYILVITGERESHEKKLLEHGVVYLNLFC